MFDWSGKMKISQGKVREKSGNFDILCEWQPWIGRSTTATNRHCRDMFSDVKLTLNPNKLKLHVYVRRIIYNKNSYRATCHKIDYIHLKDFVFSVRYFINAVLKNSFMFLIE